MAKGKPASKRAAEQSEDRREAPNENFSEGDGPAKPVPLGDTFMRQVSEAVNGPDDETPHDPVTGEVLDDVTRRPVLDGEALDLAAETLSGDMRDRIMRIVREFELAAGWKLLPEKDQRSFNQKIEAECEWTIREVMRIVTSFEHPAIPAELTGATLKAGIKLSLTVPLAHDYVGPIAERMGHQVVVLMVDPATFFGERKPAEVMKDQMEAFDTSS